MLQFDDNRTFWRHRIVTVDGGTYAGSNIERWDTVIYTNPHELLDNIATPDPGKGAVHNGKQFDRRAAARAALGPRKARW